ncbi:NUDIX hydrolase [Sphingobium indicum]|uniref:NUDIX hydrolase n=2 Tax=Sphingobium indicum TaxID=332055 RepID=A0A1L5BS50_SPHIB|nr:NUDIX domain-containing protein [Sphingobium indicum]APL95711.1 NUDIX hydrolase [Sphingobium indicum B90A]KEZ00345.1 NUDIX hydrolase [Sphingomonas sp. BHC-A]NYI23960.1 8-oxo-dGTP diphosphatase [Sphingobium indicum]RYM00108.1 NUDIX hydrolase [Sphingobium indicum]
MDISGDAEFLSDYDPTAYDRPSVTVDLVLLGIHRRRLSALLVRRDQPPQAGHWALPGGFVAIDESLDVAAARLLRDKVGLDGAHLEQLYSFGAVDRDPRMRVITIAYLALLREDQMNAALRAGRAAIAALEGETVVAIGEDQAALPLAFDHQAILTLARDRLRGKIDYSDLAFAFLPPCFTLRALQDVHEAVLGTPLNKPAFRRRMLDRGQLVATGTREDEASHRPAELFTLGGIR